MSVTIAQPLLAGSRPLKQAEEAKSWADLTDGQLVAHATGQARANRDQPEPYGELVRRHQKAVYNVAFRLVGDREEALDLAQEAFVRAFTALATFDTSRHFGPWINRIATNLALNSLEQRGQPTVPLAREQAEGEEEPDEWPLPDYAAEPERVYLAGEQQASVRRAILALPVAYRAVVELRHFQDRSYDEIAETLGIPVSDVKSHLFRARRQLRILLEENR